MPGQTVLGIAVPAPDLVRRFENYWVVDQQRTQL
jgi:hypothetical protein